MWKRLLKWAAGQAFTWGLKKLTELSPEEAPKSTPPRKFKSRKPYVN
jgi:hypothetical protein